jgi:putative addiction module CopG family antidote
MTLPPELERHADEAVAAGRFRDRSEIMAAGLRLLQQTDAEVAEFVQSLEDARAEAERDGWIGLDDMTAMMDRIVLETAGRFRAPGGSGRSTPPIGAVPPARYRD